MIPNTKTSIQYDMGEGFTVDLIYDFDKEYAEIWIGHNQYGIKELMFGIQESNKKIIKELIINNFEEYKESYKEEYMEE